MNESFCEQNAAKKASNGGIISDSSNASNAFEHLTQVVKRWADAFNSPLLSSNAFTKFFDFDRTIVQQIIDQPNCTAIRIFPGIDENGKITAVLVGVQEDTAELINKDEEENMKICCCPSNGSSALFGH